jgi:acetate kinase
MKQGERRNTMNILILNSGSSSIKFKLLRMPSEKVICSGIVERIGSEGTILKYKSPTFEIQEDTLLKSHQEALEKIAGLLLHPEYGAITDKNQLDAVGHRVVHGGDTFSQTTVITEEVKKEIEHNVKLAPLHNPHNLEGILISERLFPYARQVAVFDTAYHLTIPLKARKYAIPNRFFDEYGIKLYGFHGTSHQYVAEKAIAYLKKSDSKMITVHLGNGCSITAVVNGKSRDHSLGFAPSNGLIMGSRSGDIDHSIIFYLVDTLGFELSEINKCLTKESGMLGLTGYSDMRDIQTEAQNGNKDCQLALAMNAYRIKKYIGAYAAAMNGLDAVVFTAGIGENSSVLRKLVCEDMDFLGLDLDETKNDARASTLREINAATSRVKILVIPTNEELEIAKQAFELLH